MKYFSRSKIFLLGMIVFCVGVFLGPHIGGSLMLISSIVGWLVCYIGILFLFIPIPKIPKVLIVLMVSLLLGIWRYQAYLPKIDEGHVGFYNDKGEVMLISGVVDTEPAEKDSSLKLQIKNVKFQINDKFQDLNGKVLISVPKYLDIKYGDAVRFSARLATPAEYETFDYADYLARYGVYSVAKSVDQFEVVDRSCRGALLCAQKGLYLVKGYFTSITKKIYPEPHAALMLGILLGVKSSLPEWLLKVFQVIGITHIIAVSGYNITILARVAERTLGRIGRRYIFWGVLGLIIFFVIITGAQASIVRAGVMGALLVYAGFIGRKSNITNALVLAGTVMIFLNPLILRNDVGFQLSFLATLGLVYISPIFEKWFAKIPGFFRELLSATLAAQVFTIPIILSNFGLLSLISPIANIVILPFIPVSMFLGFSSGLFGMIWLPLGKMVGFFGYIVLEIVVKISEFLASIPYASVQLKMSNWYIWVMYYLVVGFLLWWWHDKNSKLKSQKSKI